MASSKRINILVYSGPGTSLNAVRHATLSLRRLLGSKYAVLTVTGDQILKEPWTATCALLVMPGGADIPYCRTLNGEGNRRIKQYVQMGGNYIGFCAGGYYGSSRCEFEVGKKAMEVIGDRELAFFPGICRGLAFQGFVYRSEAGAKAVSLRLNHQALPGCISDVFRSYYNGGGAFVAADTLSNQGVEVLATYTEDINVDVGKVKAAVVYRKVGDGAAIVTGPHPEFIGANLDRDEPSNPHYGELVDALIADDKARLAFMKACLTKLGLNVSQEIDAVPSLSLLHLSAAHPSQIADLVASWRAAGILRMEDGEEYIKGANDTFCLEPTDRWSMSNMTRAVTDVLSTPVQDAISSTVAAVSSTISSVSNSNDDAARTDQNPGRDPDYNAQTKRIVAHETSLPDLQQTPSFNHATFFTSLEHFHAQHPGSAGDYGRTLLYGEVVTSTSTLLEKNPSLLEHLPVGFTATATTQVAGRGRGTNVWVSPPGCLMFSTVLRHDQRLNTSAPIVFIQYLAALAIVAGIRNYGRGYDKLPVKLKWPNDIYALDPTAPSPAPSTPLHQQPYVKIGGILVSSSYAGGDYTVVLGVGLNVQEPCPTTTLNQLARAADLPDLAPEPLLASVLAQFEAMYARFRHTGFDARFDADYHAAWLHTDQVVALETAGGARARIRGITRDWGQLVAEEIDERERPTGKRWELQSDSNSFDFFKGLLKRKI